MFYLLVALVGVVAPMQGYGILHPYHVSIAEAEYNPTTASLEVALRVFPIDLERALLVRTGRRLDLDLHADVDRLLADYLRAVFVVTLPSGSLARLAWIGKEVGPSEAWLYFEFSVPSGMAGVRIDNQIFFELELDQINTINLRVDATRSTVICRRGDARPAAPSATPSQLSLLRSYPCRGRFLCASDRASSAVVPRCQNSFEHLICVRLNRRP
ncbi:MAG: DUF6702 family protein [Planctomycetota bacterium]